MTVSVARPSARRTVRVAVALVAGQAALGAVIGYVTLGGHTSAGPGLAPVIDPLAGPLMVPAPAGPRVAPAPTVPPPSSATSVAPVPPAGTRSPVERPPTTVRSPHRPALTPTPPPPAEPTPDSVLVTTTDPTTSSPSPASSTGGAPTASPVPPMPPPASPTPQQSVAAGDSCDPVDAPGLTADGTAVRCMPGDDGVARWRPA